MSQRMQRQLETSGQKLQSLTAQLEALSPLRVLARGYTMTQDAETGAVISRIDQVRPGQQMRTRLADGEVISTIDTATETPSAPSDGKQD